MFFEGVWKNLYPGISWVIPFDWNAANTAMKIIAFEMLEIDMRKSAKVA